VNDTAFISISIGFFAVAALYALFCGKVR